MRGDGLYDLLDDDRDDGYRPRGAGRRRRPPKRRSRLPRLLLLVVVLAGLLGGGIYAVGKVLPRIQHESAGDYTGQGQGAAVVQIKPGATARQIASTLSKAGVVKSSGAFVNAAAADSRSRGVQPGWYDLRRQMSAAAALDLLLDPQSRSRYQVTIAEGMTVRQVFTILSAKTETPIARYEEVAKNPVQLGLPAGASTIEGYLFPSTYDLPPTATPAQILKEFVNKWTTEADGLNLVAGARALGKTPQEIVTIASLIEREVRNPLERPKVARVIYNRLSDRTGQFRRLDLDASTRYSLNEYEGPLTRAQLLANNPYNTRVAPGLPPGAIANPGVASLKAALHPASGPWLYFVSLPKSNMTIFATTTAEWNAALARFQAEGGGG